MLPHHPAMDELPRILAVARGDEPADLLLAGGRLVNVFTGEVYQADVAVLGRWIAGVGDYSSGHEVLELDGSYVAPGLIDAHVHVESALVTPRELARAIVPRGVTTVVTDPHEIANVLGADGIRFMIEDARAAPFNMIVNASSCVPATSMATSGATLDVAALEALKLVDGVHGLAEVMNFPGVLNGSPEVLAKIDAYRGRPIDGHAPGLMGKGLAAYVAAGPNTDHEATTVQEAVAKLRLGMTVFMREATNAHNLVALLPALSPANSRRVCFCTDDRQPPDLLGQGSIDFMVRTAIENGVDPATAITMATLNAAEAFGLSDRGAVGPGRLADLIVFDQLRRPEARLTVLGGQVVARDGALVAPLPAAGARLLGAVRIDWGAIDLRIPAAGERVRTIGVIPDQLITECRILPVQVAGGFAVADPGNDTAKIAVIERHRGSGRVGLGFVQGLGLAEGAIAGTVAHDHHNLIVAGADDESMMTAARAVADAGGGLAVAVGTEIRSLMSLPIAGLMSDRTVHEASECLRTLVATAHSLGSTLHDPFMTLSFLGLEVIPSLKLTDLGLVDVDRFALVPLFV